MSGLKFSETRRGAAARQMFCRHRMAWRPAAVQKNKNDRMASNHAVIGREDAIWQKPSNFDFLGSLSLYGRRAFFDSSRRYNNTPDTAIPPLGRQIWSIRRRFYLFNRRYRSRIAYKNTKHSRQCNGFIFHLLADKFCSFISASTADGIWPLSFPCCHHWGI